jgi:hypothetical protein
MRTHTFTFLALAAAAALLACTYNAPPEVELHGHVNNRFVLGEPIILAFSEPIEPASLSIAVWPGQKDFYDLEGARLPGIEPVLPACSLADDPCAEGVSLTLNEDHTEAYLEVEGDGLGPLGQPLVLEVSGSLADTSDHEKGVSFLFELQIVDDDIYCLFVENDPAVDGLIETTEGVYLFFAHFTSPVELPQQFFGDLEVNEDNGEFVFTLTDADPISGAPRNTQDPAELFMDLGEQGFVYTVSGRICRDEGGALTFEARPFTLKLTIVSITFELRDVVLRGRITEDLETGLTQWDGTMAVREIYMLAGDKETLYPQEQANFQIMEILPDQIPEGLPRTCAEDPCAELTGKCDVPLEAWPPVEVCP